MSDKIVEKLKRRIVILEEMIEGETRSLFAEKEKVQNYSHFIETIINSVNSLIVAINEEGNVEFINQLAREKLKIFDDNIDSDTIRDILGDDIVDLMISSDDKGSEKKEVNIDDKTYLASRISYPKKGTDKLGYIYSMVDITDLKEQEVLIEKQRALLVQSTQLASLGELASGIAHEINNPVSIIDGQLRRLKDYLSDKSINDEERIELVEKVQNNLGRVVNIVTGMKKISRDGSDDRIEKVALKNVIASLKNLCSEKFKNDKIALTFPSLSQNIYVKAKETQLLQVLFNLVLNSNDAVGGLEERWIHIEANEDKERVNIRVIDSGKGIEENILKKIFNPFFSTKDIGQGTGIGLSMSKQMMQEQDGDLYYEFYNKHTSFVLTVLKA